jgi:hypothetical protein
MHRRRGLAGLLSYPLDLEVLSYTGAVPAARHCVHMNQERTMHLVIWLVVGGLIGWLA